MIYIYRKLSGSLVDRHRAPGQWGCVLVWRWPGLSTGAMAWPIGDEDYSQICRQVCQIDVIGQYMNGYWSCSCGDGQERVFTSLVVAYAFVGGLVKLLDFKVMFVVDIFQNKLFWIVVSLSISQNKFGFFAFLNSILWLIYL